MYAALSSPYSDDQTVPATMKEPSDKLLLQATTQPWDEEQLKPKAATPLCDNPTDEFL